MPGHGQGRVHRFRDHAVAGVNWRPTRFVDQVPNSRVCGLCRMIPKRTVLLPCSHALCQSCHAGSFEGGVGQCPLDEEPFEEAECVVYELPTRKASALKVHCWNEAHGCEYTGIMDGMLGHYENECTFHSVECLRCGERVLHSDLPTHYVAGCTAGASSAITECPSSDATALTLEDVSAALDDLKATLRVPNHDQLLPAVQSQLNEIIEQLRNQEGRFDEITRELGASEYNIKREVAQVAATISSTVSRQLISQLNPAEEASTSSSLSLSSENVVILRKLEHFANRSLDALEHLRLTLARPDSSPVIARCTPSHILSIRHFTSAMPTTPALRVLLATVGYILTLENCDEMIRCGEAFGKLDQVTVLHMRDTYFTFAVWKERLDFTSYLTVRIQFNGILEDSRCLPPVWHVTVSDVVEDKIRSLTSFPVPCGCGHNRDSLVHFHLGFRTEIASLENDGFLRDGQISFEIDLDDNKMNGGVIGVPNLPRR